MASAQKFTCPTKVILIESCGSLFLWNRIRDISWLRTVKVHEFIILYTSSIQFQVVNKRDESNVSTYLGFFYKLSIYWNYNSVPSIKRKFCNAHCMTYIKLLWLPLLNTKRKVDICCWLMISKQDSTCQTFVFMGRYIDKKRHFFFIFQACKTNWIDFDNGLQLVYWWFVS